MYESKNPSMERLPIKYESELVERLKEKLKTRSFTNKQLQEIGIKTYNDINENGTENPFKMPRSDQYRLTGCFKDKNNNLWQAKIEYSLDDATKTRNYASFNHEGTENIAIFLPLIGTKNHKKEPEIYATNNVQEEKIENLIENLIYNMTLRLPKGTYNSTINQCKNKKIIHR
jgi:hypothetical protein